MATVGDIAVSAFVNLLLVFIFIAGFAFLRIQPVNRFIYFPKLYLSGRRRNQGSNYVSLNVWSWMRAFLDWIPEALRHSQTSLIREAGLDSAVFLRVYILGLKIFVPITLVALLFLVPVNASGGTLFNMTRKIVSSDIDKLSISNVGEASQRLWVHIFMIYIFTIWACYVLYTEYGNITFMRLHFLASQCRSVDQFTIGFLGLGGEKVDTIAYYKEKINDMGSKISYERQKIFKDPNAVLPVAFVIFDSRWAAAVCAQTQQRKNSTQWLTSWAPEPRDIYWKNLAIPFLSLSIRRLVVSLIVFALVFFYMIPIAFVQSLANLEGLEKVAPFLRPVVELELIKSFIQGYLPGLTLKIFLYFLPDILLCLSKIEGHISLSSLERKTASKYYYFMLVNVFLGSIVTGTAFEQLYTFLHQSPAQIPRTIGLGIPMKATFFITFIMADGWTAIAFEILRLKPLVIFHLKNMFIIKTERDRERAVDPGGFDLRETLPTIELYFLLGLVYGVVSPILLPFVVVFFGFAFVVYRHQISNVYNQEYESAGAFWPHIHSRIIGSLLISHLLLLGLLSVKKAAYSTPLLIILSGLTLFFHKFCKNRFEPAFRRYPLEEAMEKDSVEKAAEPDLNLRAYLADAYLHPIFQSFEQEEAAEVKVDKQVSLQSISLDTSPSTSPVNSPSPGYAYHFEIEP
ncbi:hyperosmolality-gated Ca2+ permeable channel 1.8-like isoform X2 [Wolffia australiana]